MHVRDSKTGSSYRHIYVFACASLSLLKYFYIYIVVILLRAWERIRTHTRERKNEITSARSSSSSYSFWGQKPRRKYYTPAKEKEELKQKSWKGRIPCRLGFALFLSLNASYLPWPLSPLSLIYSGLLSTAWGFCPAAKNDGPRVRWNTRANRVSWNAAESPTPEARATENFTYKNVNTTSLRSHPFCL